MTFLNEGFMRALKHAVRVCAESVFPPRENEVLVRNATRDEVARLVDPQIIKIGELSVISLLPYRTPLVQALILEAKFEKNMRAHALLGAVLANYIKVWLEIVLIPLPLGKKRRKERGYNQVEEVARFAAYKARTSDASAQIMVETGLLVRIRETVPQMSLGRAARLKNMSEAFGLAHPLDPAFTYLLLDDVVTTGATLSAAHEALIKAGAKHVIVLALAH